MKIFNYISPFGIVFAVLGIMAIIAIAMGNKYHSFTLIGSAILVALDISEVKKKRDEDKTKMT